MADCKRRWESANGTPTPIARNAILGTFCDVYDALGSVSGPPELRDYLIQRVYERTSSVTVMCPVERSAVFGKRKAIPSCSAHRIMPAGT